MSKDTIELPKEGEQLTLAQINMIRKQAEGRAAESGKSDEGKPSDGLKVEEIRAALEEKGIAIPDGVTKKADLAALLDGAA
jgi:hypothetical protein